jgi:hypothetical protein
MRCTEGEASAIPLLLAQADHLQPRGELHCRLLPRPVHHAGISERALVEKPPRSPGRDRARSVTVGIPARREPHTSRAPNTTPGPCRRGATPSPPSRSRRRASGQDALRRVQAPYAGAVLSCSATASVWRVFRSAATRHRMSERPFGKTRQICGSCSPMRCATARMVSSSGPISAAMAISVGAATSWRHCARGAPGPLQIFGKIEGVAATAVAADLTSKRGSCHG